MKIFKKFYLILILLLIFSGCKKYKVDRVVKVKMDKVENYTAYGIILDLSDADHSDYGFCWSKNNNPNISNSNKLSLGKAKKGSFNKQLDNLEFNSTYNICAFVKDGNNYKYSAQISFKTDNVLFTITTFPVTNITGSSATSGGKLTNNSGASITAIGVCWSTNHNPAITDNKTNEGTQTGQFTSNLTNLSQNTTYYVRAYATSGAFTAYGDEVNFKTEASSSGNVIWSSDFHNAGDWTINNLSGYNSYSLWTITTSPPHGYYSQYMGKINSTTASNGFALFDSDYLGHSEQAGVIYTTNSINCSTYSNVYIEFQQYYKRGDYDTTYIMYSLDNGNYWNFLYISDNYDLYSGESTSNPDTKTYDLSSYFKYQSNVKFGFLYFNYYNTSTYAWMIDDLKLTGSKTKKIGYKTLKLSPVKLKR